MRKAYFLTLLLLAATGNLFGQFAGGNGTQSSPYQIATAEHLDNIRNLLIPGTQYYFIQTANIDLSGYANWEPIGGGGTEVVFNGFYNGQHFTISNLTINRPSTNDVGLFGHYASGDVSFGQFTRLENIVLENANVTGNNAVGALVGRVTGSQRNVIRDCFVIEGSVTGNAGVGGLAGVNNSFLESVEGQEGERPIIRRCYSNIEVNATGGSSSERIGGLVGCNSRGQIESSHSAGTVSASTAIKVGGLAGCSEELAVIINSFSTGLVDASGSEVGGLVGSLGSGNNTGTVTASYWDTETSGQSSSDGGQGRTTTQMQTQSTFSGWDFSSVWNILDGVYYPFLRSYNLSGFDLTDPGQLNAGQSFDLEITNAFNVGAFILEGDFQVTVTSNIETEGSNGLLFDGGISFIDGIAQISGLVLNTSGEHIISVTIATILNEEQILVDVAAGSAVKLLILEQPSVVTGNNDDQPALIPGIVVASVDVFDNVTPLGLDVNQEVSVTLHIDGSAQEDAILGNADAVQLQDGLATFDNLTLDKEGTGFVLRFTSSGSSGKTDLGFVDTDPFNITNIVDLSGFLVEEPVDNDTKFLQEPFDVVISNATDVTGASIAGNTNVQLSSSREGLIFNQDVSFTAGETSFAIALEDAGTHDLSISIDGVTQSVTVFNINASNDLSGFSLDLDPPAGPYYQAIPFTLKIIGAKDVASTFIEQAVITVTSNIEGVVFDEDVIFSPSFGDADLEIILFQISAPGNHILTVEIEGVTSPETIELMIEENNSGFMVAIDDPEIDIVAGVPFDIRIFDAFNVTTPISAFTGNYNVEVISDLEGEVFNASVLFNSGEAYVPLSLEIAGLHDLNIRVETIVIEGLLEDVEVEPAEAEALVIVSGVVPDVSGNNDGQPVKISDITLQTQDKFGNLSIKELNPGQTVSVDFHADSEGSGIFTGGSTLNLDISSGEATFNNLFITDDGLYKLEFSATWDETAKTDTTNFFTISDINNQAGFDIVDPGPQVAGQSFNLNIINATDSQGNLINDTKQLVVLGFSPLIFYYNQPTVFNDGAATINITINEIGVRNLSVTLDNTLTETIDILVVSDDDSEFSITPPGNQVAGVPFNLGITNAKDKAGNDLDSRKHLVTVTSDNTNEGIGGLLLSDSIQFAGGSALAENLTLIIAEEQNLTVTIDWITGSVSQAVLVEPNTATQFVFAQQPAGFADGEYEGIPRPVGTVVLQTLDNYDNLSMVGLSAPLTVTAAINTGPVEAELGGDLELNLTDSEVTFNNLTLDKNGTYTLSFTFNGTAEPTFAPNPLISDEFDMINIEDFSEFTVLDPGNQYENIPFVLQLVNATDKFGNPLNGEFNLILESDQTAEGINGEIYNNDFTFVDGELDLPLTLTTVAIHELTITLDGLNSNNIAVINVEVLPDLSAFALEVAPDPLITPVYQNNPFDLIIFNATDLDGVNLDGEFLVSIASDVAGEEEIFEGQVNFVSGSGSVTLSLPTITTYLLTVDVEGITESQDISIEVVLNPSGFTAELADLSDKVAGVDFDINISNAIGLDGNLLGETTPELHRVVITSNLSGVEFDADVPFDVGDALVTLNIQLAAPGHILTIEITGITPTEELTVTVIPAQVSQLLLTVDDPPLGGTGTGNDTPTAIGTITIRTADEFGNLSTDGISGTQEVTAGIFTDGSVGQNAQLEGDLTKSIATGVATFDDLTLDKDGTGFVLEFVYSGTPDLALGSVFTDPFDMQDVNLYQISLRDSENEELDTELNPLVFETAIEGYAPIDEEIITILRLGEGDITGILVELDTEGANHFTLTQPLVDEIAGSETSTSFTIEPNTGLLTGVYEAVVTVTANNDISEEFAVFFTVLAPYAITITDEDEQPIGPGNPLIFATVDEVYTPETRTLTVTNTGGNTLEDLEVITELASDFVFGPLSSTTLLPGQSATFSITPAADLDPGIYNESVIVRDQAQNVSVVFDVEIEILAFTYSVVVDPPDDLLNLTTLPVGYSDPSAAALEITITRTGTGPINNIQVILITDENFELIGLPLGNLDGDPDNEASFTIQPLIGLPLGTHFDGIRISADNIVDIDISIEFEVVGEIVWTGAESTAWQNSGNWDPGVVPTSDEFVVIPDVSLEGGNSPVIDNAVTVRGLIMEAGSFLTINSGGPRLSIRSGGNLTIENNAEIFASGGLRILGNAVMTMNPGSRVTVLGTMVNENGIDGVLMKSDATNSASLIHNSSGIQATVERYIPGEAPNQFHIISTPVSGQSFASFFNDNQGIISYNAGANIYAMQEYIEVGGWSTFFSANKPGNLLSGTAYSVGLPAAGIITFKGTLMHNTLNKTITRELFGWNGFGNPFAASIDTEDFLTENSSQLDTEYTAIYIFDPNLSGGSINYRIVTMANAGDLNLEQIPHSQGFIVKSKEGGGTISATAPMREHASPQFYKDQPVKTWYNLVLKAEDIYENRMTTYIGFNNDMTKGLDIAYDAGLFGAGNSFKLFTQMPGQENELHLGVQALPVNGMKEILIPVGFNYPQGGEVVFSLQNHSLPIHFTPILFDSEMEVFTDLSQDVYTAEIEPGSEATGRFYLKMESLSYYSVSFGTANEGGNISATADEADIESGAELPEGTLVQLFAYPFDGYEIDQWIVDGVILEDVTADELIFDDLHGDLDVQVSFKETSTHVEEDFADDNLIIYIFENRIVISGEVEENTHAVLYDMLGRQMRTKDLHPGVYNEMIIDGLKPGGYFIHILNNELQTIRKLLIQ